jgi:hypothetical protein
VSETFLRVEELPPNFPSIKYSPLASTAIALQTALFFARQFIPNTQKN